MTNMQEMLGSMGEGEEGIATNVDIVFVIDATRSMQTTIDMVKESALSFQDKLYDFMDEAKRSINNLVFYAGILMSNKNISSGQVYTSCSAQLKTCKVSSVVFVLVYWFCVSGLSKKECLKGYAALSKVCSRFGCIWIVFAVVNIALSIVMTITNKDSEAMTTMGKLRSSCFLMGIIFLVFSVVLKVG